MLLFSWKIIFLITLLVFQVFIPGFPKEFVLIQSGIYFGAMFGSLFNWIGMVIGAQLAYEVSRYSFSAGGRYLRLLKKYQSSDLVRRIEKNGNYGLFVIRLFPFAPNDILSLLSGALLLPRKGFLLVSFVTALPYAILFAYLGSIGSDYVEPDYLIYVNMLFLIIGMGVLIIRNQFGDKPIMTNSDISSNNLV